MQITKEQLKRIIKEELDSVLNESGEAERILGFEPKHNEQGFPMPVPSMVFVKKAQEYIARNLNSMESSEKSILINAIENRLVKDNLPKDDPVAMDLKGLLNWLDKDRVRRQGYRGSVEAEMRALSDKYDKMGVGPYDQERPFKIRKQYKE